MKYGQKKYKIERSYLARYKELKILTSKVHMLHLLPILKNKREEIPQYYLKAMYFLQT